MAFSKKKQGFPDYLLGLFEVDTSHDKLYQSYEEISVEGVAGEKAPVDFQPTYEDWNDIRRFIVGRFLMTKKQSAIIMKMYG